MCPSSKGTEKSRKRGPPEFSGGPLPPILFSRLSFAPAVVQALGSPIKDGLMPTGEVGTDSSGGYSNLTISISGPNGRGTLYAKAVRPSSRWQFTELVVEVAQTGERIDLLAGSAP